MTGVSIEPGKGLEVGAIICSHAQVLHDFESCDLLAAFTKYATIHPLSSSNNYSAAMTPSRYGSCKNKKQSSPSLFANNES